MLRQAMDQAVVKALLAELRAGLRALYGPRLQEVYLYGSYARGEADPESDLDVLVVLDDYARYAAEIRRTSRLVASLSIRYGVSVSRVFVSAKRWSQDESPFLQNARAEAVAA